MCKPYSIMIELVRVCEEEENINPESNQNRELGGNPVMMVD